MNVAGISNPDPKVGTGSLMLRVWARETPYVNGGEIGGIPIAEYTLEPLPAGGRYKAFSRTLNVAVPQRKAWYYLCVVVRQYTADGWVLDSVVNLPKPVLLGPVQRFTMTGPFRWQSHPAHGIVDIQLAQISHTASGGTGSLRLSLLATRSAYQWGARGHVLGQVNLGPLKNGFSYNSLSERVGYWAPAPGWYFVNLVLAEYDGSQYVLRAALPAAKATYIK